MSVDVVIVNWNGGPELQRAVASSVRFGARPIVVDNASRTGSIDLVAASPDAQVIRLDRNRGFSAGCNAGAAAGSGDVLLFVNPDAEIVHGSAVELEACLPEGERQIVGPHLADASGRLLATLRPPATTPDLVRWLLGLNRLGLRASRHTPRRYGYAVGAAFAIRRSTWESLGGMDESYFLWLDEVDLCARLLQSGGSLGVCESLEVRHIGAVSWSRLSRLRRQRLRAASARRYARRHLGRAAWLALGAATPLALAMGVALDLVAALSARSGRGDRR